MILLTFKTTGRIARETVRSSRPPTGSLVWRHLSRQRIARFVPVVFLACLLLLAGCRNEASDTQSEMVVPESEKIPHYDRDHMVVDQSGSFEELTDPPAELVLLYNYLQDPNRLEKIPLDLMFSGWLGEFEYS